MVTVLLIVAEVRHHVYKNTMIIHGLWPSLKSGKSLSDCTSGVTIKDDGSSLFTNMKQYWPSFSATNTNDNNNINNLNSNSTNNINSNINNFNYIHIMDPSPNKNNIPSYTPIKIDTNNYKPKSAVLNEVTKTIVQLK